MKEEIAALMKNKTWNVVEAPHGAISSLKWV